MWPTGRSAILLHMSVDLQRSIGLALRQHRARAGASQQELALRSGVHFTYISNIERGQRNPGLTTLQRLAEGLTVRTSELVRTAEEIGAREEP
jgi:transcriptional regulator with XRE-family HTH domain